MSDLAKFGSAQAVADAILYEGYLLYPYRRSSDKNRVRWQFGVVAPSSWLPLQAQADRSLSGAVESCYQQTELLMEAAEDARLHIRLRFLQVEHRQVQRRLPGGQFEPVDSLTVDGARHLTFDGAVRREHNVEATIADLHRWPRAIRIRIAGSEDVDILPGGEGRIVRSRQPLSARLRLSVHRVRLHPRDRGTDAHDVFLVGRTAVVEAVLVDTDDVYRVAVTLDDDPGRDLAKWHGRFCYFTPDEIAPLDMEAAT